MLDVFIVILCLGINAFFSAYEMAFVTVSNEEMDELEDKSQHILKKVRLFKKKPERTLSVIQIGITLVGAIAAAVGGTGAVESLGPYIVENYGLSRSAAEAIAVTVVILPLEYKTCKNFSEMNKKIKNYIHYYNFERPQWGLKQKNPAEAGVKF